MNAGTDHEKARAQAQANADRFGIPYTLHTWNGVYWVERVSADMPEDVRSSREVVYPSPESGQDSAR